MPGAGLPARSQRSDASDSAATTDPTCYSCLPLKPISSRSPSSKSSRPSGVASLLDYPTPENPAKDGTANLGSRDGKTRVYPRMRAFIGSPGFALILPRKTVRKRTSIAQNKLPRVWQWCREYRIDERLGRSIVMSFDVVKHKDRRGVDLLWSEYPDLAPPNEPPTEFARVVAISFGFTRGLFGPKDSPPPTPPRDPTPPTWRSSLPENAGTSSAPTHRAARHRRH